MKTACVVIAYFPDEQKLKALMAALRQSGAHAYVVDNTPTATCTAPRRTEQLQGCTWIALGMNEGIARAQNVGIQRALAEGADVIVFFDQDSILDSTFLSHLLSRVRIGQPDVVGPVCIDSISGGEMPSYRVGRFGRPQKVYGKGATARLPVDLIISSGSAVTKETFPVVGLLDEEFFIDYVDFEWCFRCKALGVPVSVEPSAIMRHKIGEKSVDLRIMSGVVHSVARSYYKVRNVFLLFRKASVPFGYALRAAIVAIIQHLVLLPSVEQKMAYLLVLARGVLDGLRGVVGKDPRSAKGVPRRVVP